MVIVYGSVVNGDFTCEVEGEIKDFYLEYAGIKPGKALDVLDIIKVEENIERRHYRAHKYTGIPVSVEDLSGKGELVADDIDYSGNIEFEFDLERVLCSLTDLQRYCFVEVSIKGKTQMEVAKELNKSRAVVAQAIEGAKKKLKKYY